MLAEDLLAALRGEVVWAGGLWLGLVALAFASCLGIGRWFVLARAQAMDFPVKAMPLHWFVGLFMEALLGLRGVQSFYRWVAMSHRGADWKNALGLVTVELILSGAVWVGVSITSVIYLASVSGAGIAKFSFALACFGLFGGLYLLATLFHGHLWQIYVNIAPLPRSWRQGLVAWLAVFGGYRKAPGGLLLAFGLSLGQFLAGMAGRVAILASFTGGLMDEALRRYLVEVHQGLLGIVLRHGERLEEIVVAVDGHGLLPGISVWRQFIGLSILVGLAVVLVERFGMGAGRAVQPSSDSLRSFEDLATPYRRAFIHGLMAGAIAGLVGGALVGAAEASWILLSLTRPEELRLLWWGPLVYGFLFLPLGLVLAMAGHFLSVLFQRIWSSVHLFGACLGGVLAFSILIIGRWRIARDVLYEQPLEQHHILLVLGAAVLVAAGCERLLGWAPARLGLRGRHGLVVAAIVWCMLPVAGGAMAWWKVVPPEVVERPAVEDSDRPNVVLIVADTLRADFLRCIHPGAEAETPALDQLAADGVVYRKAIAQSPWTKPSFGTIFSGVTPYAHGAAVKDASLREGIPTLAEGLLARGYHTWGFPNNPHIPRAFGFDRGFLHYEYLEPDQYLWGRPSVRMLSMYSVLSRVLDRLQGGGPIEHMYQPARLVSERVMEWLDSHLSESPFYLFFHYMDPHDPFVPAGAAKSRYARSQLGQHPDAGEYRDAFRAAYIDEIERMDQELGRVMAKLKALGLYEDSLIVFTSDHGEEFFEHGGWWHGETLYGELVHIPLIIKYPAAMARQGVESRLAHHIDIAPTVLGVAGATIPPHWKGIAWGARESEGAGDDTRLVYMENTFSGTILRALQSEGHKYIQNIRSYRSALPEEVYDLVNDPTEIVPLADPPQPLLERFRSTLDTVGPYFNQPGE